MRRLGIHVHAGRLTGIELPDVVLGHQLKPEPRAQRYVDARTHVVREVGGFGGDATITSMDVDPTSKTINFKSTWPTGPYTFQVTLKQVQL